MHPSSKEIVQAMPPDSWAGDGKDVKDGDTRAATRAEQ